METVPESRESDSCGERIYGVGNYSSGRERDGIFDFAVSRHASFAASDAGVAHRRFAWILDASMKIL
jgi:hypothetical protein